ncbi:MAG TPA: SDR family oxidoreductase [Sphingobium sp.]|nr:SDR family oxidoreductase [Sphingobium sp.]
MSIINRNLEGKVAIVTGAGGAIGSATAERLVRAGGQVAVADIFGDTAAATVARIEEQGLGGAKAFTLDISDEDQIIAFVKEVAAHFGGIDILHNNAHFNQQFSQGQDKTLLDMTRELWDKSFAVNVRGAMLLSRETIPHMLKRGGGAIVNTSSGASEVPVVDAFIAYGPSKGALESLTRYTAAQYGRQNIRCNAILPGAVLTPGMKQVFTQPQLDAMVSRTMLQRITLPEDIAAGVHFLASDDARQITGQLLRIDAGRI